MPVHDTIQMEFGLVRKSQRVQGSLITADFLQHFYKKISSYHLQKKTADLRTLRHRITETTATVTGVMFVNRWRKIEYCSVVWRATNGAHNETYWVTKEL
jgi:hypothetical protein